MDPHNNDHKAGQSLVKSNSTGSVERTSTPRESGITQKILDFLKKIKDERKVSSLGLPMRGHLSNVYHCY